MKLTRRAMKQVEEIADVLCNKCGESCMQTLTEDLREPYGLIEVDVQGGYMSTHLEDFTGYRFSVCEKCLNSFFGEFKIPPEKRDLI